VEPTDKRPRQYAQDVINGMKKLGPFDPVIQIEQSEALILQLVPEHLRPWVQDLIDSYFMIGPPPHRKRKKEMQYREIKHYEIPPDTSPTKCRPYKRQLGCQRTIYFVKNENDKLLPVDSDGTPHWFTCPARKPKRGVQKVMDWYDADSEIEAD